MNTEKYPHPILKNEFEKLIQWGKNSDHSEGVIVGCDWKFQTMIPWWWNHYQKRNNHPVAFIDLGFSDTMRRFCHTKGQVVSLWIPKYLFKNRYPIPRSIKKEIKQNEIRQLLLQRTTYFHKPFAMLQSPFQKTIWIDIDCQVNGSIAPLFDLVDQDIALTPMSPYKHQHPTQTKDLSENRVLYNSGVVGYQKGSSLIKQWAASSVCRTQWYYGDQDILNDLINEQHAKVTPLPNRYNWIVKEWGLNPKAKIIHYAGLKKQFNQESFSSFKIHLPEKPYHW